MTVRNLRVFTKVNEFDVENIDLYDYTTDLEERAGLDPILKYRIISQKKWNITARGVATVTEEGKLTYTAAGFLSGFNLKLILLKLKLRMVRVVLLLILLNFR